MADTEIVSSSDGLHEMKTLIVLFKLAHREQLQAAGAEIRKDKDNAALLNGAKKWTPSAKLQGVVTKKTGSAARTVRTKIADLLSLGLLEKRGGGRTTEYRTTGLV